MARKRKTETQVTIPPMPEGTTAEYLWEKLHHERYYWEQRTHKTERTLEETKEGYRQVMAMANAWIAAFVQAFGSTTTDNAYVMEVKKPDDELWAVTFDRLENGNWKVMARRIEL